MDTGELRNLLCYWYSAKKSEELITMRILYAASEARPFAASGGLADVAGSLPKALCRRGGVCLVHSALRGRKRALSCLTT